MDISIEKWLVLWVALYQQEEALNDRVRDHCQITGIYRGTAHTHCNLNVKQSPSFTPIALHND